MWKGLDCTVNDGAWGFHQAGVGTCLSPEKFDYFSLAMVHFDAF